MSIVWWAKVYITFKKKRLPERDKALELGFNIFLATLFTIGFVDMLFSVSQIIKLQSLISKAIIQYTNGGG